MIDTTKPSWDYFTDEEIQPILEASRRQFAEGRKHDYKIHDRRILAALEHINHADDDFMKVVWRVQQENPHDKQYFDADYLARGITNLKLFYSLEVIDGRNLHSLSKTLDVFWHAHQNFSFEYMAFCDKAFGPNQFLHHLPTDKRDKVIQESMELRYEYTRTMLGRVVELDHTFWGKDIIICCSYDSHYAEGFVFWRPAIFAMEPACSIYEDPKLNSALRKKTNLVLDGLAALR